MKKGLTYNELDQYLRGTLGWVEDYTIWCPREHWTEEDGPSDISPTVEWFPEYGWFYNDEEGYGIYVPKDSVNEYTFKSLKQLNKLNKSLFPLARQKKLYGI